jgi:hypothetical protein
MRKLTRSIGPFSKRKWIYNDARRGTSIYSTEKFDTSVYSTERKDTGLLIIGNEAARNLKGPCEDLKGEPKGMTVAQKNGSESDASYPPDITIQKLWKENRDLYDSLKANMLSNPKCANLDVFTDILYTALRESTEEGYERKAWVSYQDALDGPNNRKRILDKEVFGRFNLPTYAEEACPDLVNIAVSIYYSHHIASYRISGQEEIYSLLSYRKGTGPYEAV